jgi:hypothetical protein
MSRFRALQQAQFSQPTMTEVSAGNLSTEQIMKQRQLSQDPSGLEQDIIRKREKEYPSTKEILHVLMDHGLDSPEMQMLQQKRQAVKLKYPKE